MKRALNQINDRFIRTLSPPLGTNHKIYWDSKTTGFGVRITKNSAISFVLRYVIEGIERKYTIGSFPALSSTAAREIAIKLQGDIIKGVDPLTQKEKALKVEVFEDLVSRYMEFSKKHIRTNTFKNYESLLKNYILPRFSKTKIDKITRKEIEAFHFNLKPTLHTANRNLELLSVIFTFAVKQDLLKENPCFQIKKFKEERRERFLTKDEAAKLLNALKESDNKMAINALKLLILTGSRKNEVLKAEWKQFNFEMGFWFKPPVLQNKINPPAFL